MKGKNMKEYEQDIENMKSSNKVGCILLMDFIRKEIAQGNIS